MKAQKKCPEMAATISRAKSEKPSSSSNASFLDACISPGQVLSKLKHDHQLSEARARVTGELAGIIK